MKIYISADIEGVAGISTWQESDMNPPHDAKVRMTREVRAACIAAIELGATEIIVKDAHGYGKNIIHEDLPHGVKLISGWSNHPYNMVEGLDETFSGIIFIGYHSSASKPHSPLAHTLDTSLSKITLNGNIASEFGIYSQVAQLLEVPILTVSGDAGIIQEVMMFDSNIETVAVKQGFGGAMVSNHPEIACLAIKNAVTNGISKIGTYHFTKPSNYSLEVTFKNHKDAYKYSFYPNAQQIDGHTVKLESDSYFDILTFLVFV